MSTRNLTAIKMDGEYKVAQYGAFDGNPSGQGLTVLNFISIPENRDRLKVALLRTRFIDPENGDKQFITDYNAAAPEDLRGPDRRTPEQRLWFDTYCDRRIGGRILENVANSDSDPIILENSINFANDPLYCEYAYLIDFDTSMFQVYVGGSGYQLPMPETALYTPKDKAIRLDPTYAMSYLPSADEFLEEMEPQHQEQKQARG